MSTDDIIAKLRAFSREREWEQFHSPKNFVMALGAEAGELLEIFQWLTEEQSRTIMADSEQAMRVRHEVADVFLYLLQLCDALEIDLEQAAQEKLRLNGERYPVEFARGSAAKWSLQRTEKR